MTKYIEIWDTETYDSFPLSEYKYEAIAIYEDGETEGIALFKDRNDAVLFCQLKTEYVFRD